MQDRSSQLIKVGISTSPDARAEQVAREFGADVIILGLLDVEDARAAEKFLHGALEKYRVVGEWFQIDERRLSYLLAFFQKAFQEVPERARLRYSATRQLKHPSDQVVGGPFPAEGGYILSELQGMPEEASTQNQVGQAGKSRSANHLTDNTLERWNEFQASTENILRPIENPEHYERVAAFLDSLMDKVRGEYTRHALWPLVDYVTHLIGDYDAAHPIEMLPAREMLKHYMDQAGLTQVSLAKAIKLDQSLISKHLRGDRDINLDHARAYSEFFKVPLAIFAQ